MWIGRALLVGLACLAAALPAAATAIGPTDFRHFSADDPNLGRVTWHLDLREEDAQGPLIVWLAGSGAMPLFQTYEDGSRGYAVPTELLAYADRAHILLIDKPGMPFTARVAFDEAAGRPVEMDGPDYRRRYTQEWLVGSAALATTAAIRRLGARATRVVLIGGSEGAQFVFALANRVPATHAVAIAGIALPQYYDVVIEARLAAERGEITREEAQRRIEALYVQMRQIRSDPNGETDWQGAPYRRWAGFGPYSAVDDMLRLHIPLLMVQGGADASAPILNTDYAQIAFLNAGRTNLSYWVYPNADHSLTEPSPTDPTRRVSRRAEVYDRIWRWLNDDRR